MPNISREGIQILRMKDYRKYYQDIFMLRNTCMKHKRLAQAIFIAVIVGVAVHPGFSVSPAVKSNQDYAFTLETMRSLRIMVANFGTQEIKDRYDNLMKLFQEAGERYYGQNFTDSALKFKKLKLDLISLLDTMDDLYLKRTKEILDSTSKETFGSIIEYSKQSGLGQYFKKPFDPLKDKKPYESEKYHLFHDREKIENYLREGYRKYERAKNIYQNPDIAMMRKKNTLTPKNINYIIQQFTYVIQLCREAKQNGIEIHKVMKINELGKSLIKYNISHRSIVPIYDDRIPQEYKVDANDNLNLIHSFEMKKLDNR